MTHIRRFVVALVGALILVSGVAGSPAVAAQGFGLSTRSDGEGYATSRGNITFRSPRAAIVKGGITDRCPSDSSGAYLIVNVTFMDGKGRSPQIAKDSNGCGNGAESFSRRVPNPHDKRIRSVSLMLCETDSSQPLGCFDKDVTQAKDNPFT